MVSGCFLFIDIINLILIVLAQESYYSNTAIRKAILLTRFVNLMKWWIRDVSSTRDLTSVNEQDGIPPAPVDVIPRSWNVHMDVPRQYKKAFATFADYFSAEMEALGDETLQSVRYIFSLSFSLSLSLSLSSS